MKEALAALGRLVHAVRDERNWAAITVLNFQEGLAIVDGSSEFSAQCYKAAFDFFRVHSPTTPYCKAGTVLRSLMQVLSTKKLPLSDIDLIEIASIRAHLHSNLNSATLLPFVVKAYERRAKRTGLTQQLANALNDFQDGHPPSAADTRWASMVYKAGKLLQPQPIENFLADFEPWAKQAQRFLTGLDPKVRGLWLQLFNAARKATSATPSKRWLHTVESLVDQIDAAEFQRQVARWLPILNDSPVHSGIPQALSWIYGSQVEEMRRALRGLVWALALRPQNGLPLLLGETAWICLRKVPKVGARHPMVGNACIWALSRLDGADAVSHLSRLALKLKKPSVIKQVEKRLGAVAQRSGMSRDDLVEIGIPTFGMSWPGQLERTLGPFTARLKVHSDLAVLAWVGESGKEQKSVPALVRSEFAGDLAELKQIKKELELLLPAQKERIERLLLSDRSWRLKDWGARYLNHPLVGTLARRLVWHFSSKETKSLLCWFDGALRNLSGRAVEPPSDAVVRLWHPIGFEANAVRAWRGWLEEREIQQPFKQAHREIYILTEAEIRTNTYSNRFAAHILKQHQFQALLQQRGWRYTLQGGWDSHNTPYLEMPHFNLRVEFFVDAAGDELTPTGIHVHVATDQVRFVRDQQPLSLATVPALAFTEAMRDVDLFVGVCSVGNDPQWQDQGNRDAFGGYWRSFSFGELSETAKTRREVLERLVPRLKIAPRCRFDDRFLVVRGDLRTYKIHMGSGNILMEPNDQYLCIVPSRDSATSKVMLPFDGDRTLSIILSKALLLADDKAISDETITRQLAMK